jgi:ALIX V-shaped domain binding to HIV/UBA/TS-N domain
MSSAQEGDKLVLHRLELLDTDPKYKLLQFRKSQLDRLLPAGSSGGNIDVSNLNRYLVELSTLFDERESLILSLQNKLESYDISADLALVREHDPNADVQYKAIVKKGKESFQRTLSQIESSLQEQTELIQNILAENEIFMQERDSSQGASSADRSIIMIEDAVDEIDQLYTHLKEGRDFYDVVIPKMEKLRKQVGEVSTRLTIERCEFEDDSRRIRQEADDARMAASMNSQTPSPLRESRPDARASSPQQRQPAASPGIHAVSHGLPEVRVDDEKLASLVAMEFDPDRVVMALRKYDNNFEQALNELLSG